MQGGCPTADPATFTGVMNANGVIRLADAHPDVAQFARAHADALAHTGPGSAARRACWKPALTPANAVYAWMVAGKLKFSLRGRSSAVMVRDRRLFLA